MLSPISTFSIEQSRKNGFKGAFQVYKVKVAQIQLLPDVTLATLGIKIAL